MIRHSFGILKGVGAKIERRLWQGGVLSWEDFVKTESVGFISGERKKSYDQSLLIAAERLAKKDAKYFKDVLPSSDQWRLFDYFKSDAVCLDIETNGLSPDQGGHATMVGLYDGRQYKCLVRGGDLTADNLMQELSRYKYIVTFFGLVFDVPFLAHALPGFKVDVPHFDLCFGAKKIGIKGGLKSVERKLGIERPEEVRGMDGYDAVLLWNRAERGDADAMRRLMQYNKEDTVNLMYLADIVYNGLMRSTGIGEYMR